MERAWHYFHTFRDVFLLGRTGKKAKAKANALSMELMKKRMVGEERNAESWTQFKKRHKRNTWRDYIRPEIDVSTSWMPTLTI